MEVAAQAVTQGAIEGTTIIAGGQFRGRGRHGRTWFSAPGTGLFSTTVVGPIPVDQQGSYVPTGDSHPLLLSSLSLVAGAAVLEAVRDLGVADGQLQWPNDVVVHHKKLAGVLLETVQGASGRFVLVGIGLNIARKQDIARSLPADIVDRYVSIADCLATKEPAAGLVARAAERVLAQLEAWYDGWRECGLRDTQAIWRQADALLGIEVQALGPDGFVSGVGRGLSADGALRIETADGLYEMCTGEIIR